MEEEIIGLITQTLHILELETGWKEMLENMTVLSMITLRGCGLEDISLFQHISNKAFAPSLGLLDAVKVLTQTSRITL